MTGAGWSVVLAGALLAGTAGPTPAGDRAADESRYVGPGACAARSCHGAPLASPEPGIAGDEYVTWSSRDPHARAHRVLGTERAARMARLLGLADAGATPADWLARGQAAPCLGCHAGPDRRHAAEGVSCEACHGAAAPWLTRHATRPRPAALAGMVDTGDPARAAEVCLGCHLGTARDVVDHRLIAAGHPALVFELDTFASRMPPHWRPRSRNARWQQGGAWVAGQAAQLHAVARQLARQPPSAWPEFSLYDCYACHQPLERATARASRGRAAGIPGEPPWDPSRTVPFLRLARVVGEPARLAALERTFAEATSQPSGPAAGALESAAAGVLDPARDPRLDRTQIDRLLHAMADPALAQLGFRSAQQAAWALDALVAARASAGAGAADRALTDALAGLFAELGDPARYDPARTARHLDDVRQSLP